MNNEDQTTNNDKADKGNPLLLAVIVLVVGALLVNAFWTIGEKKHYYKKCNSLWALRAPPTGILFYEESSGVPIYRKQPMPDKFKKECIRKLKAK